ncbi:hypothetical protein [Anaeroselena agilis]|uniref:DUF4136 domain-containing protein n=1 Tax=Anaeroselena agilis TaxID=3063788 RepID=A0ABU3NWE4_9FIRM|nr:hypothetical protein [Selenomonadales bacterium 4137-cl]
MRRLLCSILAIALLSSVAFTSPATIYDKLGVSRPSVAVITSIPQPYQSKDIRQFIIEKMEQKLTPDKYKQYIGDVVATQAREYAERHRVISLSQFNKDFLVGFGREYRYDYVVYLAFEPATSNVGGGGLSVSVKQEMLLRGRVVDVANDKSLYDLDIIEKGGSSSVPALFGGAPSWEKARKEAIGKALDEFNSRVDIPLVVPKPAE